MFKHVWWAYVRWVPINYTDKLATGISCEIINKPPEFAGTCRYMFNKAVLITYCVCFRGAPIYVAETQFWRDDIHRVLNEANETPFQVPSDRWKHKLGYGQTGAPLADKNAIKWNMAHGFPLTYWQLYKSKCCSPPQNPNFSLWNTVRAQKLLFLKIYFNIISPGCIIFLRGLFASGFPTKILYLFFISLRAFFSLCSFH